MIQVVSGKKLNPRDIGSGREESGFTLFKSIIEPSDARRLPGKGKARLLTSAYMPPPLVSTQKMSALFPYEEWITYQTTVFTLLTTMRGKKANF